MKKKSTLWMLLAVAVLFAGCGDSGSGRSSYDSGYYAADNAVSGETNTSTAEDAVAGEPAENASVSDITSISVDQNQTDLSIDREMLVYTCDISIDTLTFDESVARFKTSLLQAGGFVERESYDDNYYSSSYRVEDDLKDRIYTATVRVPSGNYDSFLEGAQELGDVRSKSAYVENVSQEYSDLGTALEIYEAKEERYINLLSTITDDEYALEVERELTDLQIQIAQIKTRMNQIKTDVAYSYINVTIHAVREYVKEPAKTDTFGQRLSNQIHNTWNGFLWVLETVLFVFIGAFPYLAIWAVIILVILKLSKKAKVRRNTVRQNAMDQNMVQQNMGNQGAMNQQSAMQQNGMNQNAAQQNAAAADKTDPK